MAKLMRVDLTRSEKKTVRAWTRGLRSVPSLRLSTRDGSRYSETAPENRVRRASALWTRL